MLAFDDQPAPFFLTHFAVLMSFVFLPLIAVMQGLDAGTGDNVYWVKDIVQGVIVFLTALGLLGLRVLANMLSDPYGDDLLDLSVLHYINNAWTGSNRMLNAEAPEPYHDQEEVSHSLYCLFYRCAQIRTLLFFSEGSRKSRSSLSLLNETFVLR